MFALASLFQITLKFNQRTKRGHCLQDAYKVKPIAFRHKPHSTALLISTQPFRHPGLLHVCLTVKLVRVTVDQLTESCALSFELLLQLGETMMDLRTLDIVIYLFVDKLAHEVYLSRLISQLLLDGQQGLSFTIAVLVGQLLTKLALPFSKVFEVACNL